MLNNYWVTNFKASQKGELNWSYTITSTNDISNSFATHFGREERTPLPTRILLPSMEPNEKQSQSRSLLSLDATNLFLVNTSLSIDGKGIILHLRETDGEPAKLDIRGILDETGASSAEEVSVLEKVIKPLSSKMTINAYETRFIRLGFK